MPKAMLRSVRDGDVVYEALMFVCPGCVAMDAGSGLRRLPVNTSAHSPSWTFDGNLEAPTVSPSILTSTYRGPGPDYPDRVDLRCHSMLEAGVFRFLGDSTHELAGQSVPMPDLPEWVLNDG